MKQRNWSWRRIPAKIKTIEKWKTKFGSLHIRTVLEVRENDEVELLTLTWAYTTTVYTSDKIRSNLAPGCFDWAYKYAEPGMDVTIHHCLDDNARYFYYC